MGRFTIIPENTFNALQLDAGVLLKNFNPEVPTIIDEDIICATTGGINPVCTPTYSDFGEDVDNVPVNMMEFKHLDGWECTLSTTSLGTSPELIKLALGCADIDGETKIVPRMDLKQTDFKSLWWVGDRADGGFVAIELKNALSTGGFSLQTTKNGKGNIALTITGHVSINAQKEVPMVFYSCDPTEDVFYTVRQTLSNVTSTYTESGIASGENFEATLEASEGYTMANVIVLMDGEDVTATAYTSSTGVISITGVSGDIQIIATATE